MKPKKMPKDAAVLAVLPCETADAVAFCNELNTEHKQFHAYRHQ